MELGEVRAEIALHRVEPLAFEDGERAEGRDAIRQGEGARSATQEVGELDGAARALRMRGEDDIPQLADIARPAVPKEASIEGLSIRPTAPGSPSSVRKRATRVGMSSLPIAERRDVHDDLGKAKVEI